MKKVSCIVLSIALCFLLAACGSTDDHSGEAKTPSGSSIMNGRDYESVVSDFEEHGFTNIKLEKIEDLITGWLTDDGEVERVTVGGDEDYSPDKWVPSDIEVVIYYHTFSDNGSDTSESEDTDNPTTESPTTGEKPVTTSIVMPYGSDDYCSEEWTLESLVAHLTDHGFTNITTVACDPDDDRYKLNIFEIYIATGLFSDDPWVAGETHKSDAEISIYYNEAPLLTIENCPDLVTVLTSKDMSYLTFANEYDGRYVEFDAYVSYHDTYDGGTSHIISVLGGNYDGVSEIGSPDSSVYSSVSIRIGDRTWGNDINTSVELGDAVRVSGKIDESWSEYYNELYVETLTLSRRQ